MTKPQKLEVGTELSFVQHEEGVTPLGGKSRIPKN